MEAPRQVWVWKCLSPRGPRARHAYNCLPWERRETSDVPHRGWCSTGDHEKAETSHVVEWASEESDAAIGAEKLAKTRVTPVELAEQRAAAEGKFGRFAREDRERQGLKKPETFEFLGFTHIAGVNRQGGFLLRRRTSRRKRRAKLASLKEEAKRRRHWDVNEQHRWLASVLRGHYQHYAVPTNYCALRSFHRAVANTWHRSLQRRSQRGTWSAAKLRRFEARYPLPIPRILHPWPTERFAAR